MVAMQWYLYIYPSGDWWWQQRMMKLSVKAKIGSFGGYPRLFSDEGDWSELMDGGYNGREAMHGGQGHG